MQLALMYAAGLAVQLVGVLLVVVDLVKDRTALRTALTSFEAADSIQGVSAFR